MSVFLPIPCSYRVYAVQPNRRYLLLDRKYAWIAEFKRGRLGSLMKRKHKDLNKAEAEAKRIIEDLQKQDQRWTQDALREQWALQKEEQLSVRSCKFGFRITALFSHQSYTSLLVDNLSGTAQNASNSISALVDTQRAADALARHLDDLDQVIAAHEYRNILHDQNPETHLDSHYAVADDIRQRHELVCSKLAALMADIGLLQVSLPVQGVSQSEKEFMRDIMVARGIKLNLWDKISKYHDEINPLRESRRRGGKSLLGTLFDPPIP